MFHLTSKHTFQGIELHMDETLTVYDIRRNDTKITKGLQSLSVVPGYPLRS